MEQLLKVTSVPLQTIQFSQKARLVPADSLDLERRKTMARYFAFQSRQGGSGSIDFGYISQVNKAFSTLRHSSAMPAQGTAAMAKQKPPAAAPNVPDLKAAAKPVSVPAPAVSAKSPLRPSTPRPTPETNIPEPQAAYTMQRGSFEMRVAKGELAYIPPLVMTIITQYPEIHFEYTGDDYPCQENASSDVIVDLSI